MASRVGNITENTTPSKSQTVTKTTKGSAKVGSTSTAKEISELKEEISVLQAEISRLQATPSVTNNFEALESVVRDLARAVVTSDIQVKEFSKKHGLFLNS